MKRIGLNFYAGLIILISVMLFKGSAGAYDLMKYYPLKEGITWNYLQEYSDGGKNYEIFCVGGTETINGAACKKYWEFDSGELSNEPNDRDYRYECQAWTSKGLMLYKVFNHDGEGSYYFVCDPALKLFPRSMSIGQIHTHSTNCTKYDPGGNVMGTSTLSRTITLEAVENKQIITGTYTGCLRVSETFCEGADCDPTTTSWLAPGIGEVKRIITGEEDRELISYTNGFITYIPEGGVILKRTPLEGLHAHGTAPPPATNPYDNVLTPLPELVNYSFHKASTVNIGTGLFHNIGIQASSSLYVDRLFIYVNKNVTSDTNLTKVANWKVYKSNSNTVGTWTAVPISSVAVSVYDSLQNIYRYEIRFSSRQKAGFYKAVNMKTVNASGLADVFVTEIEAYGANAI